MATVNRIAVTLLQRVIGMYRYFLSPMLSSSCRFYPSCSCYANQALQEHGFLKGLLLSLKRISRCHPFVDGGYDPVPQKSD